MMVITLHFLNADVKVKQDDYSSFAWEQIVTSFKKRL